MLRLTAEIVAAYAGSNTIAVSDLPSLIAAVAASLRTAGTEPETAVERPTPAVPIKRSVTSEFLVCLEDGRKMTMLKRYLATHYQMTPGEYRRRWGLSDDYPMVAPAYAERRSALAKQIGLGRKPAARPVEPAPTMVPEPKRKARGRRKAA